MGARAYIRQNEGTGDVTVPIALLLVHHASALSRIGGAQIAVVNLHGHHSVRGETAHAKGNHAVLIHRRRDSRGGAGGRCLRTARRQSGCGANTQAQRQGCGSAGGQRLRGQGCLRGSRKRCTHGGPFKITGVELNATGFVPVQFSRSVQFSRLRPEWLVGHPAHAPVQGCRVKSVGREPVPV